MSVMMMCGHAAQGTKAATGAPVCVICSGIRPGADQVADQDAAVAALAGRTMRCSYRNGRDGRTCVNHAKPRPSTPDGAFFKHQPDAEHDQYYCGCWGWD